MLKGIERNEETERTTQRVASSLLQTPLRSAHEPTEKRRRPKPPRCSKRAHPLAPEPDHIARAPQGCSRTATVPAKFVGVDALPHVGLYVSFSHGAPCWTENRLSRPSGHFMSAAWTLKSGSGGLSSVDFSIHT